MDRYARHLERLLHDPEPAIAGLRRELDPRLHQYQVQAVHHLQDYPRSLLWLEMGLGKTAISLQALTDEHLPALVVSTARAARTTWVDEAKIWRPDLDVVFAKGSPSQRSRVFGDVVTISQDSLANTELRQFRTVILDEISAYKKASTNRYKAARKICKDAKYVWGLTGTPAPNGYVDLWSQVALIDQGARLGRSLTRYRKSYLRAAWMLPSGAVAKWEVLPGAPEQIDAKISDITLAMRSADYLDLPSVKYNPVSSEVHPRLQHLYRDLIKKMVLPQYRVEAQDRAGVSHKLRQFAAGFLYDVDGHSHWLHDDKINLVKEIVEGTGGRSLVFYQFEPEKQKLLRALPEATDDPDKFEQHRVLVAHPASVGHGLNFQHLCSSVVWSSLPWSSELYQQANARVNRQGQTKPVIIHLPQVAPIDTTVLDALDSKIDIQDAMILNQSYDVWSPRSVWESE